MEMQHRAPFPVGKMPGPRARRPPWAETGPPGLLYSGCRETTVMGIQRGRGAKWILLAACIGFAGSAHAACTGPQAIVARVRAHPTTENSILLGSWFASHRQLEC